MPRARRRRRGRGPRRRPSGGTLFVSMIVLALGALLVGSIVEIRAQSAPYRSLTDRSFGELASEIIVASNQTGARLSAVIDKAPTLPNQALPYTARAEIQQGLDAAQAASADEVRRARLLAPPLPTDDAASRLLSVLDERAVAVSGIVSAIDGLLGMSPITIAGAPVSTPAGPKESVAPLSQTQASRRMAADGSLIRQSDRRYAAMVRSLRRKGSSSRSMHLPSSRWAPPGAPLGPTRLRATPALLESSAALVPFHAMVITAVGLTPPAIPSATPDDPAGSGMIGVSCNAPSSTTPGPTPTVVPPTTSVTPHVTVTNCGTVAEHRVVVVETLKLDDPPGTAAPKTSAAGSTRSTTVTASSGQSQALSFPALTVATGHDYLLTITLVPPVGQADPAGTSQQFLLEIVG